MLCHYAADSKLPTCHHKTALAVHAITTAGLAGVITGRDRRAEAEILGLGSSGNAGHNASITLWNSDRPI
jgi:hypothetical protein